MSGRTLAAIFILATTEKHKVIPTILSRCQIYDFNRIEISDITDQLKTIAEKEGMKVQEIIQSPIENLIKKHFTK